MTVSSVPLGVPAVANIRATDSNGSRVYLVVSVSGTVAAHAPVYHVVSVEEGGRLKCQCRAATFGRLCRHQRAVATYQLAELKASRAREDAARRAHPRDSAPPALSNAAFSIWKQAKKGAGDAPAPLPVHTREGRCRHVTSPLDQ